MVSFVGNSRKQNTGPHRHVGHRPNKDVSQGSVITIAHPDEVWGFQ